MKVLQVITEGDMGGAQRHVLDLSGELIARGHAVIIAVGGVSTGLSDAATHVQPAIPVIRLKNLVRSIDLVKDIRAVFELRGIIAREKPDVVHCHSSMAGAVGAIAGWLARTPVVYTAHGFVFQEDISWYKRWMYRVIERTATWFRKKVIAVSQSDADAALTQLVVPRKKMVVIHNGLDTRIADGFMSRVDAREALSEWAGMDLSDAQLVVSIANLYPAKNIPGLIHAFEYVVRRMPEARLVVIGDGEQRTQCEQMVQAQRALQSTVFLVGQKPDAYQILRGADVLCLASTKEGFPYALLEAKLAGVPVVATRVGGIPEIGDGPRFKLVVANAPDMLAECIVDSLRTQTVGEGDLPAEFTLSGMTDAVERVYREVSG